MVLSALALSGCQDEPARYDIGTFDPSVGAQFRAYARDFLFELYPSCELTKYPDSVKKIKKFENDWSELRRTYQDTSFAVEFAIADADHKHEFASRPVPECMTPDTDGSGEELKQSLGALEVLLTELRKIAKAKATKTLKAGG